MPRIKSAIKRVKTSEKSHLRNISYKSKIKSSTKRFNLALSGNNKEESIQYFKDTISILDKSVNKGIFPKNTASRQKSNLTKKLNTLIKSEQIKEPAATPPEKALETQKKPVTKKPAVPKKKTATKKTAKPKEKPVVKKVTKAAKAKKADTKKEKK
jgi:small subunit ribosomal protein S20